MPSTKVAKFVYISFDWLFYIIVISQLNIAVLFNVRRRVLSQLTGQRAWMLIEDVVNKQSGVLVNVYIIDNFKGGPLLKNEL